MATIDLGPLRRRRDFRLLFIGQGFSFFGSMVTFVAVPFQAYHLTGSTLADRPDRGRGAPAILITAFLGGALADAFDRRRLVQIAELGLAGGAALLLINSLLGEPRLWVLFVAASPWRRSTGSSGRRSTRSSRGSSKARAAGRERARLAAHERGDDRRPAFGGVLIATAGLPATYALRPRDVRVLAGDALADARRSAAAGRRAAERQARCRGDPLRSQPPGADRDVQRRLHRHVLRDADGALPRLCGEVRRGRRARDPLRGAGDRVARHRAHERLDRACPQARPRGDPRRRDVGRRDGRIRARADASPSPWSRSPSAAAQTRSAASSVP